jgi:uncharacterized protein
MTNDESSLINSLFDRLAQGSAQPRDPEAEALIAGKVAANPAAPYLLTQAVLVMQQAVASAQSRISQLESQLAETKAPSQQGGFLSGIGNLFGSAPVQAAPARPVAPPPIPQAPPVSSMGGGGFLQGALATAAGVAGGALLFQGIENLLGHNPGPFVGTGGFGSGEGFAAQAQPTEIINNYYGDNPGQDALSDNSVDDPAYADNTDDSFDQDSGFDGGGDDSSFV